MNPVDVVAMPCWRAASSAEDVLTELGLDESDIATVIAEVPKLAEKAGHFLA